MVGTGVAANQLQQKLEAAGYPVLQSRLKYSSALDGPAHIFKKKIRPRAGSPMDDLAREVLGVIAR